MSGESAVKANSPTSPSSSTDYTDPSMAILDTAFIIDTWGGDEQALALVDRLDRDRVSQKVSAMTVFELYHGVVKAQKPEDERRRVMDVLESKTIVDADRPIMSKAGRQYAHLDLRGKRVGEGDCIVAATGLVLDEPVVTRNVEHFTRFADLEILEY